MPGRRTDQFYIDKATRYANNRYVPTGMVDRSGKNIKIEVTCTKCHNTYMIFASLLTNPNKGGCSWCSGRHPLTTEIVSQRVLEKTGGQIKVIGKYTKRHDPLKLECNWCGNIWVGDYGHIMSGRRCPQCSSSYGEQSVSAILDYNNIDYNQQKRITLKGRLHQVDKVVRDSNGVLCVIQPDGEQHIWVTRQIDKKGKEAKKEFEHRVSMDMDENKYLSALGIRVLRIPWFWFDLDNTFTLLQDFLGYELKKPSKDYVPVYKRVKDMVYDYLNSGSIEDITSRYKVGRVTLLSNFKRYFGTNRSHYVSLHPEYKKIRLTESNKQNSKAVVSLDSSGNRHQYASLHEAERATGISCSNISGCLHGRHPSAGGLRWKFVEEDN